MVSRFKEEIHAGLNTGIIRGIGATGRCDRRQAWCSPVTLMSMIVSADLQVVGQLWYDHRYRPGVDTLIVRAFMTPSIAAALLAPLVLVAAQHL